MAIEEQGGQQTAEARKIAPATGKLGVMVVGLGAVATTMIAGVEAVRRGTGQADWVAYADGHHPAGQAHRQQVAADQGFCAAGRSERRGVHGLGHLRGQRLRVGRARRRCWTRRRWRKLKPYLETIKPMPAVFDQYYVKRLHGTHVKKGKNKRDLADQVIADIRAFKKTVDRVVMIWCGSTEIFLEPTAVHQSHRGIREGSGDGRHRHCALADLCVCGAERRRSLCQRRAEPDGGSAGDDRAVEEECGADLRQGLQDRADVHEDGAGAGLQGAHAGRLGLVLDQHSGQPRRRSAGRSAIVQDQGRVEAGLARVHLPAGALSRSLQGHLPQDPHQLLPAARRRQRSLGQHRHLRLAGLSDADQGELPVPRLDSGGADCAGPGAVPRPGQAHAGAALDRHSGVAELLSEIAADGRRGCIRSTICSSSR